MGAVAWGEKKKKEKKFHSHSIGKKFRSDLKSKKLKILKRFKTKENRIVTPGLYCLLKGWKKKSWMEERRDNGGTISRKRAQEIHESPTTNLFSLERNPTQPWTTLKASKTHFVFPVGRSTVCWNFTRGSLIHLVFPDSVENIIYICSRWRLTDANFPLSKSPPSIIPSIPFYFSTRV